MYCAWHADRDAVWECLRCEGLHCDACVRRLGDERVMVRACAACDGLLRPLAARVVQAIGRRRRAAVRRVLDPQALVIAGVLAVMDLAARVPIPVMNFALSFAHLAALAATYMSVVDHVARGKPGFPAPVEAEGFAFRTHALRGLLCALCFFTPFALWLLASSAHDTLGDLCAANRGGCAALLVVQIAWTTAAILAVVGARSGLAAYWPPMVARAVWRVGAPFAMLLAEVFATTAVAAGGVWTLQQIPLLGGIAAPFFKALAVCAQAALVGDFVRENREVMSVR